MPTREPIILFYSRSGHSQQLAVALGAALQTPPVRLGARFYGLPALGWLLAGLDGGRGAEPRLREPLPDIEPDALVILIGPVWADGPAAPLNTVAALLRPRGNPVAAILTAAGPDSPDKALTALQARLGRGLVLADSVPNPLEGTPGYGARVADLAGRLRSLMVLPPEREVAS
ncbi:hypothetical protein KUH32_02780 [Thalassococcus sp. CAU 1522]|uniref:Flavodoxin n=1 Tax=Thalassococcus arenae TaxID=2851652 RepID=A0ABS6N3U6_9RHOB|nr:hypothetical protein [Thalassococcus arenae]MBV2358685.1 hypothetical protein [Thalassococcus arenae]